MAVSPDILRAEPLPGPLQFFYDLRQHFILRGFIVHVIRAFQFDTDGEVVAVLPPVEFGCAGMPGALVERDELHDLPFPIDQEMSGYFQPADFPEVRMRGRVQSIAEQLFDAGRAELAGRQADAVYDKQADINPLRPVVKVWRCNAPHVRQPLRLVVELYLHNVRNVAGGDLVFYWTIK